MASTQAFRGIPRIPITAPRNGTNRIGLVGMPSRRSAIACPSSWTNRRRTKSAAKCQPQSKVYAPIETTIEPAVVRYFSLMPSSSSTFALVANFASNRARPPIGANTRRSVSRRPERGWIGPLGVGDAGAGARRKRSSASGSNAIALTVARVVLIDRYDPWETHSSPSA